MNIFHLDSNPAIAARMQCDKHVVKMVLESAQMLSTVHHLTGSELSDKLYKCTHKAHPCTLWVKESKTNYEWLFKHLVALLNEYTFRYAKIHKTSRLLDYLCEIPDLPNVGLTEQPQCMYDDCKRDDLVDAYRTYYKVKSTEIQMKYTNRQEPIWLRNNYGNQ